MKRLDLFFSSPFSFMVVLFSLFGSFVVLLKAFLTTNLYQTVIGLVVFVFGFWIVISFYVDRTSQKFLMQYRLLTHPFLFPIMMIGWVVASGLLFTLPVGPLSDEGMILFMEGGCDWGNSNLFFFSRLGLIAATNIVFLIMLGFKEKPGLRNTGHFFSLAAIVMFFQDSSYCDGYYGHPQGNIAQTALEIMGFAALALSVAGLLRNARKLQKTIGLFLLNGLFVGAFYLGLIWFKHWDWGHSFFVMIFLLLIALATHFFAWRKALINDKEHLI